MASINKVTLVGYVGGSYDMRHVGDKAVSNFRLATTTRSANGEQTEWHNIVAWERLADVVANYVKSGSLLYIEGSIRTRSFDGSDGQKRYVTEIIAREIQLLGGGKPQAAEPAKPVPQRPQPQYRAGAPIEQPGVDNDDLPF